MAKQNPDSSRRDVLKSIGAVGAAGATGTATMSTLAEADDVQRFGDTRADTELDRTVEIQAVGRARYSLAVTGLLTAEDAPEAAVSNGTASETVVGDSRTFQFTGEFTELSVDGNARVMVDGEPFDVGQFPQQTLEIVPRGEVRYDVSASGAVEVDRGTAEQPNARTATARTRETHVLSYAGELTHFELDGNARVRRNGTRVEADDVLPSTLPHEFTATCESRAPYTIETTRAVETQGSDRVGTDTAPAFHGRTVARYAGHVTAVEHPNGARVEIDDVQNEVVTSAPQDRGTRVAVETTKGLVVDGEAFDTATLSPSAGEESVAVPFGEVVRITIDDLTVELAQDAYPAAEESTALQAAATVERTDAFQRLAGIAAGRVRHDAAGIAGEEVVADGTVTVRSVELQLANLERGDGGVVSVRQTSRGVEHAGVRYREFADERMTVEAVSLPIGRGTDTLQRERETMPVTRSADESATDDVEHTAALFAGTANPNQQVRPSDLGDLEQQLTQEDVTTQGFLSFLNDVKNILEDIGADVYDTALFLWDVFEGQLDKVAITAQNIVISSPYLIAGLAENLPDANIGRSAKLVWRFNIAGSVGLVSLASAGLPEAMNTGFWCAGCVFLAIFLRDFVLSEGASYVCFYFAPALPAAVVCTVAMEVLIQFGSQYFGYHDVQNQLCDGDVVAEIDPC